MKLLDKITKKFAGQASDAVKETVKKEARNLVKDIVPIIAGAGAILGGVIIFKHSSVATKVVDVAGKLTPVVSNTVTNNYFFSDSVKEEVINKLLNQ